MVRIHEYREKKKLADTVHMMLHVHDELVFEIKDSEVFHLVPVLKKHIKDVVMFSKQSYSMMNTCSL